MRLLLGNSWTWVIIVAAICIVLPSMTHSRAQKQQPPTDSFQLEQDQTRDENLIDLDNLESRNMDTRVFNKPQPNFYFHQPNQVAAKKKQAPASHMISNRNAAALASSGGAPNRLLKKQGKNKQIEGMLQGSLGGSQRFQTQTTTTTTTQPPTLSPHPIQVNVTAKVGETVMLACVINSAGYNGLNPGVIWMQGNLGNVLTLNTNRITVDPRFEIVQQPLPSQSFQMSHRERPSSTTRNEDDSDRSASSSGGDGGGGGVGGSNGESADEDSSATSGATVSNNDINNYYHLRITNVQLYDENEYACERSITKNNEDQPSLHSLVYLHVTQSPSFIESLTSESNIAVVEYVDVVLKCFAVGKPSPKIRWYQIDETNGSIRDLNHEATSLTINNISKSDNSKYECVASNGILPSVSKKFTITVYYAPVVKPILQKTNQYMEQTVALGCLINSNPESAVNWYKFGKQQQTTRIGSDSLNQVVGGGFEPIDATNGLKYQVHKYRQANQTVSYLKIKISDLSDYTKYKCEATNTVGRGETVIELLELKEGPRDPSPNQGSHSRPMRPHSSSSSDEDNDLDDSDYFINLEHARDRDRLASSTSGLENEYQLTNGGGGKNSGQRPQGDKSRKPARLGNLVSGSAAGAKKNGVVPANKTLYKYNQLSKSNRIVNTNEDENEIGEEDDLVDDQDGGGLGDDDHQTDHDSEANINRINKGLLSSKSNSQHEVVLVQLLVALAIASVLGFVLSASII